MELASLIWLALILFIASKQESARKAIAKSNSKSEPLIDASSVSSSMKPPAEAINRAAEAVRAARYSPATTRLHVWDVGIVVERKSSVNLWVKPYIVTNYQPYTALTFRICDQRGKVLAEWHLYERLDSTYCRIMPKTAKPIKTTLIDAGCEFQALDERNHLILIYPIEMNSCVTSVDYLGEIETHLTTDGEIDEWTSGVLNRTENTEIPLNELIYHSRNKPKVQ